MNELIIVCVGGVRPWAVCQYEVDKTEHGYYSIISRHKSYVEVTREWHKATNELYKATYEQEG